MLRRQTIEYYLIVGTLLFSFFYFVLRALVWDSFIWITIVPGIAFLYAAAMGPRFLSYRLNFLDKLFVAYLVYGVLITGVSVLYLGFNKTTGIAGFIHFYWPAIIYFVARSYTQSSEEHTLKLTRLMWLIAILLLVDVAVEYYFVVVKDQPLAMPWTRFFSKTRESLPHRRRTPGSFTLCARCWRTEGGLD